jgi:signal peptidase II
VIDYLVKNYASSNLTPFETVQFLPFLNFYLTSNTGIAFSMFDYGSGLSSYVLLFIAIAVVIFLIIQLLKETNHLSQIGFVLIIGGALGNIIDRALDGAVTDFLHFYINNFSFFIFNPADAFITIGAIVLIFSELKKTSNV